MLLFLLRPNSIIPLLVRVPVTSKGRFLKYSTRLLSTLTPISSVVTKITLEKATSKQGKPYALFNFQTVSTLSPEEAAQAKAFGQQFMEIVNAAQMVPELAQASYSPLPSSRQDSLPQPCTSPAGHPDRRSYPGSRQR